MKKLTLGARERRLLIVALVLLLIVAAKYSVQHIQYTFKDMEERIDRAELKLNRLHGIVNNKDSLEVEYKQVTGDIPVQDANSFLQGVERLAAQNSLKINMMKPKDSNVYEAYTIFTAEIELQAPMPALAKLIGSFEAQRGSIGIERLQFYGKNQKELPRVNIVVKGVSLKQ